MKRTISVLSIFVMLTLYCIALGEEHLSAEPSMEGGTIVRVYESGTLDFTVERFVYHGARCYLTRLWMEDPSVQIEKGTSTWHKNLMYPSDQAKRLPVKAMVVINGSGFVSPQYPEIPDNYPGKSSDYFYTPLGSLTITNGEIFRNLQGVPYYGITLEADGLHMYVGEDNEAVIARNPLQTWSFYTGCPLVLGDENLVDTTWRFANEQNIRTIVGRMPDDTVILLTVTAKENAGLTMIDCADFLIEQLQPLWAFNLDGGPSTALLVRPEPSRKMKTVYGNIVKNVDIMAFCEKQEGK